MKVSLVSYNINPLDSICSAASNCYDSDVGLSTLKGCYSSGHHSVFEFANFHFHIEGISRACSHQLVRHRTSHFAQRSQRYVNENNYTYVIPKSIADNEEMLKAYKWLNDDIQAFYEDAVKAGIPAEDARYALPNACETVIDMGFDFRNLMHFCNERLCSRAQWEIREVAKEMVKLVSEVSPELAQWLVPKCEAKQPYACPERKSCGRHKKCSELVFVEPETKINPEDYSVDLESSSKYCYLVVAPSGAGKDTVVNKLCEDYGLSRVKSYTTRPKRKDPKEDLSHIFVNKEEFDAKFDDMVAYTEYNGYEYGCTSEQVDNSDLYIIDVAGIEEVKQNYSGSKEFKVINIKTNAYDRLHRMRERGDLDRDILDRVNYDAKAFKNVDDIADVQIRNDDIDECVKEMYEYIKSNNSKQR